MRTIKAPFSGDVTQAFKLFTQSFAAMGSQFGFININTAQTSAPEVEQRVVEEVGSYGRQLGRIGDVMAILMARAIDEDKLTPDEKMAVARLKVMLDEINSIKEECGRKALRIGER